MTEDVMIVAIVFGVAGVILFPLVRAWGKRLENRGAPPAVMPADVTARLERIERAVESVAVEVERISEGQRFVTKVFADRAEVSKLPPAQR